MMIHILAVNSTNCLRKVGPWIGQSIFYHTYIHKIQVFYVGKGSKTTLNRKLVVIFGRF